MVTQVITIGLYCPQTGETRHEQLWYHGGPFDPAEDILERMQRALVLEDTDRYEIVESRQSRNPRGVGGWWEQLDLFGASAGPERET